MAFFEDVFKGGDLVSGMAVAVGAIVLAPIAGQVLRPAAKAVIKGGIMLSRSTGLGDLAGDIVAEARAEIDEARSELDQRRAPNGGEAPRVGRRPGRPAAEHSA